MNMSYLDLIRTACSVFWALKRKMFCPLDQLICLQMLSTSDAEAITATKNGHCVS
jgi:hypothetical protein